MELLQKLEQQLTQQQLQCLHLLQLSSLELEQYLQGLSQENPLIDVELPAEPAAEPDGELLAKLQWLEAADYQNRCYLPNRDEDFDPFTMVGNAGGLEETLVRHLKRQIFNLPLADDEKELLYCLADCLDDDGYLRIPRKELCAYTRVSEEVLEKALSCLKSLDPPGVGAESLGECLALQVRRMGGPEIAERIAENYLEDYAHYHYRAIAQKLGVSPEEVKAAGEILRKLEPRPGRSFVTPDTTAYVQPDVFVEEDSGGYRIRTRFEEKPLLSINKYYQELLSSTEDKEVRRYLSEKLSQAEAVVWGVAQRESTLKRCARVLVEHQRDFFTQGASALKPLTMAEVARELGVHTSTISRTVNSKYLQCPAGLFPLSFFFVRSALADQEKAVGNMAVKEELKKLIEAEDTRHPLSDQKLCELLAGRGCPISRRTVAKYRAELNIPGTTGRKCKEK